MTIGESFKSLRGFQEKVFDFVTYLTYILLLASGLGLSQYAPAYVKDIDYYTRVYVCLFLIIRFNPFVKIKFDELDRKIAFAAGFFILTTTALNQYVTYLGRQIKTELSEKKENRAQMV
jgi:hypothetical protein